VASFSTRSELGFGRRAALPAQNLISLTTDYGTRDHFVGSMKAVLLTINPAAVLVDISHEVATYSIIDAAFTIGHAYPFFPSGTVHLVVVDPDVGSDRRPLLVQTGKYYFVGPDNGVLSFIYEREERVLVRHITAEHYFLQPVSRTFHGRDVFSPIAAWVSKGIEPSNFGPEIGDYRRFAGLNPQVESESLARGIILKADKFGNLITNFSVAGFPQFVKQPAPPFRIEIAGRQISTLRNTFAEGAAGEVFAIVGSTGYVELVCNRGSAARLLNAGPGADVVLNFG
jgi:S-adenosylmethionine hydrolase